MPKVMFQDPPAHEDLLVKLRMLKFQLTDSQISFLKEHDGHRGISVDGTRAYCRTCNRRDGQ